MLFRALIVSLGYLFLYLEIALKYKVKQSKNGKFPSIY